MFQQKNRVKSVHLALVCCKHSLYLVWNYFALTINSSNEFSNNRKNKPRRSLVWQINREKIEKHNVQHVQGDIVKNSDTLVSYIDSEKKKVKLVSSVEGFLYFFSINNVEYGVVSDDSDNKDSIKAWINSIPHINELEVHSTMFNATNEKANQLLKKWVY